MKKFCLLTIVLFTSVYSFADVSSVANNAENQCKNLIFNKGLDNQSGLFLTNFSIIA